MAPLNAQAGNAQDVVARYRSARVAAMQAGATAGTVDSAVALLADSVVYEHPQAGARITGRTDMAAGMRSFLGAMRNVKLTVTREIVLPDAVAAEEQLTFESKRDDRWQAGSRTQLMLYEVRGGRIVRLIEYWRR
jgi:hypothetical protein